MNKLNEEIRETERELNWLNECKDGWETLYRKLFIHEQESLTLNEKEIKCLEYIMDENFHDTGLGQQHYSATRRLNELKSALKHNK